MRQFYVYGYIRHQDGFSERGTPYYVGKGKNHRAYEDNRVTPKPVNRDNIVFYARNILEKDALQLEMLLIFLYGRIDRGTGCLRNLTDGGDGQRKWIPSKETRARISASLKGKRPSLESRQKMSLAGKGIKKSPEHVAKIRNSLLGVPKGPLSVEHREKLSAIHSARKRSPHSAETCAKIALGRTGKKSSEETKLKISNSLKRKYSDHV